MKDKQLERIEKILQEAGYITNWINEEQPGPSQYLLMNLPEDDQGRERKLIIKNEEAAVSMPIEGALEHHESFIHFTCFLPFTIEEASLWEVLRSVNFFNRAIPTPGFILDENLRQVFFRYTFLKPGEEIKKDTLLSLIGMTVLWLDTATPTLEKTGHGQAMTDVIKERLEVLQNSL